MTSIHSDLFFHTYSKNIPLMCVFELTNACNLRCAHCYVCKNNNGGELKTAEIKSALKQIAASGCMYIVFTGGEVFLRKDVFEICGFAKSLHFDLRIFTNAALINDIVAREIKNAGVSAVEVSLYGRQKIHDRITGVPGSFNKTINALTTMRKKGINLTIKCPIMNINFQEYRWLIDFAEQNGIRYKFDVMISPKSDGGSQPLKFRMGEKQIRSVFSDRELTGVHSGDSLRYADFSCSAGKNFFSITPGGDVLPCLALPVKLGNIRKRDFNSIWNSKKAAFIREIGKEKIKICSDCNNKVVCRRCPGFAMLEDGDIFGPSKAACLLADASV